MNNQMNNIKSKLEAEKTEIMSKIRLLQSDKTRKKGAIAQDLEEQAVDLQNDEVVDSLENIELARLNSIEIALSKIDEGSYGFCESCGEKISTARLNAMPDANECIECASLATEQ